MMRGAVAGSEAVETLSRRALNRALLARQLLLRRERRPVLEAVEHLTGLQAQEPKDPYVALWTRLDAFDPAELERLLLERQVARAPLMRATIHLMTARDCLALRPLLQPAHDRTLRGSLLRRLAGADLAALAAAGRALLQDEPRTLAELRALLGQDWAGHEPQAVGYAVSYLVPLVQVPPRGLWSRSGRARWIEAESWLGGPTHAPATVEELRVRYLRAFGPATAADFATWSGISAGAGTLERLRPALAVFRDERGRALFDLPEAPRPDPETPAPPRFLPQYDNVFLSHADRGRIVSEETRRLVQGGSGYVNTLLVDGFVGGLWRLVRERRRATLRIRPLAAWSPDERGAVEEEAWRLLDLLAPQAEARDLEITTTDPWRSEEVRR